MPLDLADDKSTLVQVKAWCRQATSHYLSQCWLGSLLPYGVARPQWVNLTWDVRVSVTSESKAFLFFAASSVRCSIRSESSLILASSWRAYFCSVMESSSLWADSSSHASSACWSQFIWDFISSRRWVWRKMLFCKRKHGLVTFTVHRSHHSNGVRFHLNTGMSYYVYH